MSDSRPEALDPDQVVQAAIRGESGAWEQLVGLWSRRVYAAAKSRLRDPDAAEEVTQSVMVTVFEHISTGRYTHTGQFESWLFRIAMNRVRDRVRRTQRHRTHSLELSGDPHAAHDAGERSDTNRTLRDAIASLPEADQEVLSLRHHAQLGFGAIAEMLGQPLGTVLARHHRAVGKLRAMLEPEHEQAEA